MLNAPVARHHALSFAVKSGDIDDLNKILQTQQPDATFAESLLLSAIKGSYGDIIARLMAFVSFSHMAKENILCLLRWAIKHEEISIIELVLSDASAREVVATDPKLILQLTAQYGHASATKKLISLLPAAVCSKLDHNKTLTLAAKNQHFDVASALLATRPTGPLVPTAVISFNALPASIQYSIARGILRAETPGLILVTDFSFPTALANIINEYFANDSTTEPEAAPSAIQIEETVDTFLQRYAPPLAAASSSSSASLVAGAGPSPDANPDASADLGRTKQRQQKPQ